MKKNKLKLILAHYDEETGVSTVCLSDSKLGEFFGYAKLHPLDKHIASSYVGCEIAKMRAKLEYYNLLLKTENLSNKRKKQCEENIEIINYNLQKYLFFVNKTSSIINKGQKS